MEKPENKYSKIGENYYNLSKAKNMYANRFEVVIGDEEIILMSGIERGDSTTDVEAKIYLTLPSFYRLYDVVTSTMNKLK